MSVEAAYAILKKAKRELKHENRFFGNDEFNRYLNKYIESKQGDKTFRKKDILFRARLYLEEDQDEKYNKPTNEIFQGYDAAGSFVNLSGNTKEGRINPQFISYLYVSTTIDGAVVEVRPFANTMVSIARIDVIEEMHILDFSNNGTISSGPDGALEAALFGYINREFSKPCYKEGDYLLPQYISEYVKREGYDGVMYASAFSRSSYLDEGSYKNIAVFNYKKCRAVNSKLYMVDRMIPKCHAI